MHAIKTKVQVDKVDFKLDIPYSFCPALISFSYLETKSRLFKEGPGSVEIGRSARIPLRVKLKVEASMYFSYHLSRITGLVRTREDNLVRGIVVKNFLMFVNFHLSRVKPFFKKTLT